MNIRFSVETNLYNCKISITDNHGARTFFINSSLEETELEPLEVDLVGDTFELTVIPVMADYKTMLNEIEQETWKDKVAVKIGNFLCSTVNNMLLRVGCTYRLTNLKDGDTINIATQGYLFSVWDRWDFFGLLPMMYTFYEVSCASHRFTLLQAFAINRTDVIKSAKKLALVDFGIALIVTYPIQVGRVKRLASNKKISKTLKKFNQMNDAERQRFFEQQEKFMSN